MWINIWWFRHLICCFACELNTLLIARDISKWCVDLQPTTRKTIVSYESICCGHSSLSCTNWKLLDYLNKCMRKTFWTFEQISNRQIKRVIDWNHRFLPNTIVLCLLKWTEGVVDTTIFNFSFSCSTINTSQSVESARYTIYRMPWNYLMYLIEYCSIFDEMLIKTFAWNHFSSDTQRKTQTIIVIVSLFSFITATNQFVMLYNSWCRYVRLNWQCTALTCRVRWLLF